MESFTVHSDPDRKYGAQEVQNSVFQIDGSEAFVEAMPETHKTIEVTVEVITEEQCLELCHIDTVSRLAEIPVQVVAIERAESATLVVLGVPQYPHGFKLVLGHNYYAREA
jgi:hypothetical protein